MAQNKFGSEEKFNKDCKEVQTQLSGCGSCGSFDYYYCDVELAWIINGPGVCSDFFLDLDKDTVNKICYNLNQVYEAGKRGKAQEIVNVLGIDIKLKRI